MSKISIGRDAAIYLYDSEWWKGKTDREIVEGQLFIDELCCDYCTFQEALENTLGRSIWTHDLADDKRLIKEFLALDADHCWHNRDSFMSFGPNGGHFGSFHWTNGVPNHNWFGHLKFGRGT